MSIDELYCTDTKNWRVLAALFCISRIQSQRHMIETYWMQVRRRTCSSKHINLPAICYFHNQCKRSIHLHFSMSFDPRTQEFVPNFYDNDPYGMGLQPRQIHMTQDYGPGQPFPLPLAQHMTQQVGQESHARSDGSSASSLRPPKPPILENTNKLRFSPPNYAMVNEVDELRIL